MTKRTHGRSATTARVRTVRFDGVAGREVDDAVAVEAPLGIELDGKLVATTMRTPGDDRALALGLLATEGLLVSIADVESLHVESKECDLVRVDRVKAARRRDAPVRVGTITSACGLCGRVGLEELLAQAERRTRTESIPTALVHAAHAALASLQPCFAETGGVHAAAAFETSGRCLASAEDVGRHNAVDKVVGKLFEAERLADAALLVVSGRTSFEIVHKAIAAGIGAVAGVSAPSSLAVELAERAGLVLAGFVRGGAMNVYSSADRLDAARRPTLEVE